MPVTAAGVNVSYSLIFQETEKASAAFSVAASQDRERCVLFMCNEYTNIDDRKQTHWIPIPPQCPSEAFVSYPNFRESEHML